MKTLVQLIENFWGEDTEQAEAFARLIVTYVKPESREDVVRLDLFFNRYNSPQSYEELAQELMEDECLQEDNEDYFDELTKAVENNLEESFLAKDGWRIDSEYGGAIGFDPEILLRA